MGVFSAPGGFVKKLLRCTKKSMVVVKGEVLLKNEHSTFMEQSNQQSMQGSMLH